MLHDPAGEFAVDVREGERVETRGVDARFRVEEDVVSVQRHTLSRFDSERPLEELAEVLTRRHAAELDGAPLVWTVCEWAGRAARCARGHAEVDGVRFERRGVLWREADRVTWLDVSTRRPGDAVERRFDELREGWRWLSQAEERS
ncbi:MAG: hypothetical protein H6724_15590 [Sandaracinus sp.]|nr:hypothetical protein [Sandaracinus sp.]